ncbi:MAG: HAD family hydrolase [Herpetosiphonaceae bacterium]|nr:HAD family hydrolase [Herpetosiphonaceae bacterium]
MSTLLKPQVVLFDLYGTLIDIHTDERSRAVWQPLARFLRYQGLPADDQKLRHEFFSLMRQIRRASPERHPEWDGGVVFGTLLRALGYAGEAGFITEVAQLFRVLSMRRLGLFSDTLPLLQHLHGRYRMGLISDAQRCFLEPELAEVGLSQFFDHIVVSSDYGYRKPDPRLFAQALAAFEVPPDQAVFIGDNLLRDVSGAVAARIPAIWLARPGARTEQSSARPDLTISGLAELEGW